MFDSILNSLKPLTFFYKKVFANGTGYCRMAAGLILATYCVRYTDAMPFLWN